MRKLVSALRVRHVTVSGYNTTCLAYLRNQGGTASLLCHSNPNRSSCGHTRRRSRFPPSSFRQTERPSGQSQQEESDSSDGMDHRTPGSPAGVAHVGHTHVGSVRDKIHARLLCYVSPLKDPKSLGREAFARSWKSLEVYAYPPTSLIQKVVAKYVLERPLMILVTPFWPAAPWFPDLLALAQGQYFYLGLSSKTLLQSRSVFGHANAHLLNLTAWLLSPGV